MTLHIQDDTPVANKMLINKNSGNVVAVATKLSPSTPYSLLVTHDGEKNTTHELAVSLFPKLNLTAYTANALREDGIAEDTTASEVREYMVTLGSVSVDGKPLVEAFMSLAAVVGDAVLAHEYYSYFYYTECFDYLWQEAAVQAPEGDIGYIAGGVGLNGYSCIDWKTLYSTCANGTAEPVLCAPSNSLWEY